MNGMPALIRRVIVNIRFAKQKDERKRLVDWQSRQGLLNGKQFSVPVI